MKKNKKEPFELTPPVHTHPYRVIYGDTDTGRVVYYGNYMRFFEIGRTEFMRSFLGIPYSRLEKNGLIFPVTESYCRYKAPARYDDLLHIKTSLHDYSKYSIKFHYEISRSDDNKLIALGYTVHAAVDPNGKLIRLPPEFVEAVSKLG